MIFKKARQNRIFQDIVDQVQEAVVSGELKPGEKLPPEREMCSIFNTSRGTLREALRILEQKKLVTIKLGAGGGAVVRETNGELLEENLLLFVRRGHGSPDQLIEFTAETAGQLASRAATRVGGNDIEPLKQLVTQMAEMLEEKPSDLLLLRMDGLLLDELGRIAGNSIYGFILQAALETIARLADRGFSSGSEERKNHFQEIRMIVYGVAKNERQKAARLTYKHFRKLAA